MTLDTYYDYLPLVESTEEDKAYAQETRERKLEQYEEQTRQELREALNDLGVKVLN